MTFNLFPNALSTNLRHRFGLLLLAFSAWVVGSPTYCLAATRTVALSGDSPLGTLEVFAEGGFGNSAVINNSGEVAFSAALDDLNFSQGIWSEGDGIGSLRKVALAGEAAPGGGGAAFGELFSTPLYLNDAGDVSFTATLDDFSTNGVWTDRDRPGTALTKIALAGDPVPDISTTRNFQGAFSLRGFNNNSQVAFSSGFTLALPPDNFPSSGVFSEGAGLGLDNVAEINDPAPGAFNNFTNSPGVFTGFFPPSINDSGHVAFQATTNSGTSTGSLGAAGVWTNSNNSTLRKVALAGESAPGTSTTFSQLFRDAAVINNSGNVAFSATLVGLINGNLREGIWVERGGVVEKVAIESESAPGTSSTFENMSDGLIDENGHAVFQSILADGTDGLWRENSSGTLVPVALENQTAPGTSAKYLGILEYAINAVGQVAFAAQMDDFSDSIFAIDKGGVLQRIVGGGDLLEVASGDLREVDFVEFLGLKGFIPQPGNGLPSGLNDSGEVAYYASFLDGSEGIFVSDIATLGASPADFDEDGDVDSSDLAKWETGFGISSGAVHMDGDADVDGADFLIWQRQFGLSSPLSAATAAVPEPSTWLLALCATLCVGARCTTSLSRRRVRAAIAERTFRTTGGFRFAAPTLHKMPPACGIGSFLE